jgi:hypothetical protein
VGAQLVEAKTTQITAFKVSDVLLYLRQHFIVPVGIKPGDEGIKDSLGFLRHPFPHLFHHFLENAGGSPIEHNHSFRH